MASNKNKISVILFTVQQYTQIKIPILRIWRVCRLRWSKYNTPTTVFMAQGATLYDGRINFIVCLLYLR